MSDFAYLKPVDIHGVASCIGAQNVRCYSAPLVLQELGLSESLSRQGWHATWCKTILVEDNVESEVDKFSTIGDICRQLSRNVAVSVASQHPFITIGGDHSCAIGTWSGAASAVKASGDIGLIWIDAHMDAHTPDSSPSGAIHGMPVASLLGYGPSELTSVEYAGAKIKPQNLCLIGIRSYEAEEKALLERLGVKIFYVDEIQNLGAVFQEAVSHVTRNAVKYGISLDLDAIDPMQAPGVGSPEHNGLNARDLINAFSSHVIGPEFLGFEVVELNSFEDKDDKTAKLAINLVEALFK